ncbi:uncharacterized protein FOMMEDRAFT_160661 [Fomitiporia mediterranea MF3/22]|uniref:uncharacterized protein n=1 Tax=Fomitiporia mediterranea (strain MF3/22) TaxID=694068 RepID=UPI00044085DE|nr:uncharacterized protein FOMMEDRAFT_160661 [Fomitiporia mediterranea MF3/22]EJC99108.1 hypothetical protein FOMMEDRAFT_160661 [Fomitiporia mediterranea MF3/22]
MPLRFTELNDDVLIKILFECTLGDVLALESTCRSMRSLLSAPNRPLWLYLIQSLDDVHAPDLPPSLPTNALSSTELKQLVTRAVRGYTNWNQTSSSLSKSDSRLAPHVTRLRSIDPRNTSGLLGDLRRRPDQHREIIKILPGGRYVFMLWSAGYLQCWDTEENKAVWTYPQLGTFVEIQVLAFDVQFDVQSEQVLYVIVGRHLESIYLNEPCFLELAWFNPNSRRSTQLRARNVGWEIPSLVRICGDAIILSGSYCVIANRQLDRCFALREVDILRDTISVVDNYFTFIGKASHSNEFTLFALDAQRIFSGPRAPRIPIAPRGRLDFTLSIQSDLHSFTLKAPIPTGSECVISAHLVSCTPTWRGDDTTTISVMLKLFSIPSGTNTGPQNSTNTCTRLSLFTYRLTSRPSPSSFLPPSLSLVRTYAPISIPLPHPYCVEDVHVLSHSGRGIISSVNKIHGDVRYYAFSLDTLFRGNRSNQHNNVSQQDRHSFNLRPILFGREWVAPGEVYMEKYSGSIVFVSKGLRTLIIQYYD